MSSLKFNFKTFYSIHIVRDIALGWEYNSVEWQESLPDIHKVLEFNPQQ